jgi:dienelactone hydrolase
MSFRERVLSCLGKIPSKPDVICVHQIDSADCGTYERRLIEYSVEPDEVVRAYLLVPKGGAARYPAIVASHQHAGEYYLGKSEPAGLSRNAMYHYGLDLCHRGYVVICPDHLAFEDRRPPEYERKENTALDGGNYERYLFCKCITNGTTLQAKYLSDLTCAIDVLESLDFVDKDRIGAIGHSLGGQETLWLAWYDERIKAGVSSCGFGQLGTVLRDHILHNLAMFTFGFLEKAGDVQELIKDMAPRAFMMTNGLRDPLFPMDGVRDTIRQAGDHYEKMGVPDHFQGILFDGEHSFPDTVKKQAYDFLDSHLKR